MHAVTQSSSCARKLGLPSGKTQQGPGCYRVRNGFRDFSTLSHREVGKGIVDGAHRSGTASGGGPERDEGPPLSVDKPSPTPGSCASSVSSDHVCDRSTGRVSAVRTPVTAVCMRFPLRAVVYMVIYG